MQTLLPKVVVTAADLARLDICSGVSSPASAGEVVCSEQLCCSVKQTGEGVPENRNQESGVRKFLTPDSRLLTPDTWLEIGFGGGEHLAAQAEANRNIGFIGAEFFVNGVASLLAHIDRLKLENVRILVGDGAELLAGLPDASIGRAFVLFPDPWPKKKHTERRFISRANLDTLARVMKKGAELRVATDDPVLLPWMLEQLHAHPSFEFMYSGTFEDTPRPTDWPPTRYELKNITGIKPWFMRLQRR